MFLKEIANDLRTIIKTMNCQTNCKLGKKDKNGKIINIVLWNKLTVTIKCGQINDK